MEEQRELTGMTAVRELTTALQRIRSQMRVDTAVVLTLDPTRRVLEPFAISGLDRSRQGAWVRVPVGKGFAGTVAAGRGPVVIDEVTEANVYNPILRESGVRSLAGIPLLDEGDLVGVLHVGSFTPRHFDDADVAALTTLSAEIVELIRHTRTGAMHTAALVLQRSLMPTIPPRVQGLDIAGRYVPAEGDLGGDWYDVFKLPNGRLSLVTGDVVGHGLLAAVVMGRLRSALRAYALIHDDPAQVLTLLDFHMAQFEPDVMATVMYGVTAEPYDTVTFSAAGHWPPIVAHADGTSSIIEARHDLALGVDPRSRRTTFDVTLEPGGALCLFTDGLLEVNHDTDPHQVLKALAARVAELDPRESAELNSSRLLSDAVGTSANVDDIALLLVRRLHT
jgi:serine phosphatase RsbU (regulator of sigma subunit)